MAVLVSFRGEVFGQDDLDDYDFVFASRTARMAVLIYQQETAIALDATGVPAAVGKRSKFNAARLYRATIVELHSTLEVAGRTAATHQQQTE